MSVHRRRPYLFSADIVLAELPSTGNAIGVSAALRIGVRTR
jgi:hypothetical protein